MAALDPDAPLGHAFIGPRTDPRRSPSAWWRWFHDKLWEWAKTRFPFLADVPDHWRGIVALSLFVILVTAGGVRFSDKLGNIWWQWYGPDVVLGVIPKGPIAATYGTSDLVNEYIFRHGIVREIGNEQDLVQLLKSQPPTAVQRFHCPPGTVGRSDDPNIYKITTVSQNLGHRTAEHYQATITFASSVKGLHDPGVRVLYVGADDLRISYLYQHDEARRVPACLPSMEQRWQISPVARQTYGEIGLTRDMVILAGNLPPQVFQTIDIVAYIPCSTRRFVAIFQVQCPNCRFFYRMTALAQVLELPGGCPPSS